MTVSLPSDRDGMRGACGVNAVPAVGEFHGKDSVSGPSGEQNLQLAEHQIPILAPDAPMLLDALGGKIEHSAQGIVIGKAGKHKWKSEFSHTERAFNDGEEIIEDHPLFGYKYYSNCYAVTDYSGLVSSKGNKLPFVPRGKVFYFTE